MPEEEKTVKKRLTGKEATQFKPGNPGGPGHPKDQPNYKQRFRRDLEELATWKAPDAVLLQIKNALPKMPMNAQIGFVEAARVHLAAMMGETWAFDRLHDRPAQAVDITSGNEKLNTPHTIVVDNPETKAMLERLMAGDFKKEQ